MNYDDLLNRIEEEAGAAGAPASGPGSGVSSPGSEGATTEDNIAYLPSNKKKDMIRPICKGKKKQCKDVKEDENDLSSFQSWMKDRFGEASDSDMEMKSTYPGEDQIKFWLLEDGTFIHVPHAHYESLPKDMDYRDAYKDGMVRGYIDEDDGSLSVSFSGTPNFDQISSLESLAKKYDVSYVWVDRNDEGNGYNIQSSRDLGNILRGKVKKQSLAAQFHESMDEGENDLPDVQQRLLDIKGVADKGDMFATSSYSGEKDYVKFWLLNNGSLIWVDDSHLLSLEDADIDADYGEDDLFEVVPDFISTGAIRISSYPGHDIDIDFIEAPTTQQIQTLIDLVKDHNTKEAIVGDGGGDVESAVIKLKSPKDLSRILRGQVKHQSLAAQFHESLEEAMEDDMTKLREDLKPALVRLFDGDPFHYVERDADIWKSRFGVDRFLTANAPLVPIENKVRGLQKLAGTLLQKYGNDRGYLEMLIDSMDEREPLNSFDGFKSNDYLYGTRMRSSHEGIEMVFEAALDPLYNVSETVYVGDTDVLDRWEELARGIKRVGNTVFPKGERFTPGLLQLLEHAIIDTIDAADEVEAEEEME